MKVITVRVPESLHKELLQEAKSLIPKIKALYRIKGIIEKGGEPVFTVKQIKKNLGTLD